MELAANFGGSRRPGNALREHDFTDRMAYRDRRLSPNQDLCGGTADVVRANKYDANIGGHGGRMLRWQRCSSGLHTFSSR